MKLYAIYFPEKNVYYVNHEDGEDGMIKSISVDKNVNCVVGIGKEKNARSVAKMLTAFSGFKTKVVAIERNTEVIGDIAEYQVPAEEIPEIKEEDEQQERIA